MRFVSQEVISAIRTKAELARRLSGETIDPAAKARLLESGILARRGRRQARRRGADLLPTRSAMIDLTGTRVTSALLGLASPR